MLNAEIALLLHRATGLALAPATVERAIRQRMKHCEITRLDAYLARLRQDDNELAALTELVVVPETWFFRDAEAFDAAVQCARELLALGRSPVSFLTVPCATGEEPYSLVMALLDAGIPATDFRIDAIDISGRAIGHALRGVYGRNAFRTPELTFRNRHFAHTEHGYELKRYVRDCVTFFQENLLKLDTAVRADRYDIVFCRNLLIYFDEATQKDAVSRLATMLRDDGMLFAGYAEVPVFHQNRFRSTRHPRAFGLRKTMVADASKASALSACPPLIRRIAPPAHVRRAVPATACPSEPAHLPPQSGAERPDAQALLEQARTLADRGDFKTAAIQLAECLRHRPDSAEANLLYGLVSERNGDLEAAESHLRRAVYLDPHHYQALCHLAILTEKRGNAASASAVRARAARVFRRLEGKRDSKGH